VRSRDWNAVGARKGCHARLSAIGNHSLEQRKGATERRDKWRAFSHDVR